MVGRTVRVLNFIFQKFGNCLHDGGWEIAITKGFWFSYHHGWEPERWQDVLNTRLGVHIGKGRWDERKNIVLYSRTWETSPTGYNPEYVCAECGVGIEVSNFDEADALNYLCDDCDQAMLDSMVGSIDVDEQGNSRYDKYGHFVCDCGWTSCGGGRGCGDCSDCYGEICECHLMEEFPDGEDHIPWEY